MTQLTLRHDSMRVTAFDPEAFLYPECPSVIDTPICSTSERLNQRPVTVRGMKSSGCLWPEKAMGDWLHRLAQTRH